MNKSPNSSRTRRYILIVSVVTDAILGAAILPVSFGFFPIDIATYGLPPWTVILVGGLIFTSGIWMIIYNYSRLDE